MIGKPCKLFLSWLRYRNCLEVTRGQYTTLWLVQRHRTVKRSVEGSLLTFSTLFTKHPQTLSCQCRCSFYGKTMLATCPLNPSGDRCSFFVCFYVIGCFWSIKGYFSVSLRKFILTAIKIKIYYKINSHITKEKEKIRTRMWANAQPDGHPAKHRWRPLFNAAKFGWRPLLDAVQ